MNFHQPREGLTRPIVLQQARSVKVVLAPDFENHKVRSNSKNSS